MMPNPISKRASAAGYGNGDGITWIKVFADGSGDHTTLSAAFAAHTAVNTHFLIKGIISEPDSADATWLSGPLDSVTDARLISPSAGQHLHFIKGAGIILGARRLLIFRRDNISIRCESPIPITIGQSPHVLGTSIVVGPGVGLDFAGCTFRVSATTPVVVNSVHTAFLSFGKVEYSQLGLWELTHSRAVTHSLGGTTISNLKFASTPYFMRHCSLDFVLKSAIFSSSGWTVTATYGFEMTPPSGAPTARAYEANRLHLDICALPEATTQMPFGSYGTDMTAAGLAANVLTLLCRNTPLSYTGTNSNIYHVVNT